MRDLRDFLDRVKKERSTDLISIEREVNPRFETTAILIKFEERQRSPVLLFKNMKGSQYSVVSNVCGSQGRIALALGCTLREISARYAEGIHAPIKPIVVKNAPIHENVAVGAEVNLLSLPTLVHHESDADTLYLTAAIGVVRDLNTGHINLSFHRLMVVGRNKTGILIEPGKHLDCIYQKYRKANQAMPIAFFIGAHPLWTLGALYSGPAEEYDIIGGLLQEPLSVVQCITQAGLFVPAGAEIALEGTVAPDELMDEGPFGEWSGFSTGVTKTPVFKVSAMTTRNNAIIQDIVSGHTEHLILEMPAIEYRTLNNARAIVPGVTAVSLIAPMTSVVALKKSSDNEPKLIMDALLKTDIQAKHLIVVDADVRIGDLREVFRAIGLNTQASHDVYIYPHEQGTFLDPSCTSPKARTAKMGIDATRSLKPTRRIVPNRVPADLLDSIDITEFLKR